jgi:DNA (cytosine-5)-methyltransferase 1
MDAPANNNAERRDHDPVRLLAEGRHGAVMQYLSVCSGIEAASVAWHSLGWQAAGFAEIEPFPCAVLKHHYPTVPNYGDLAQFKSWPDATVDLLVGGTPCQSFSVAGLRKGLDDPRGNLALTYLAVADRYRPRWLVWENVPGVLSSGGGRDFGAFLGGLGQLGYGFAYRVLDAQFFGVAQRRRRVFVVGYLGDWRRAAAVLFDGESLSGHPPPSRETRERIAPSLAARTRGGGGLGTDAELDGALLHCASVATPLHAHFGATQGLEDHPTPGGGALFVASRVALPERRSDGPDRCRERDANPDRGFL